MADFRVVTEDFAVSAQIAPEDVVRAATEGYVLIINNRPDFESADQPSGESIRLAADSAGLAYLYAPIVGRPSADQAAAIGRAAADAGGKVLAFCRSGTRSMTAWAIAEAASGARSRDDILDLARRAGYDIAAALP